MKLRKLGPWLYLLFGVTAILALAAWDYMSLRLNTFQGNTAWVRRVSDMVTAERMTLQRSVQRFRKATVESVFDRLPDVNPSIVALLVENMQTHSVQRWNEPAFGRLVQNMDPRLVVLQLKAVETDQTQMGPVVFLKGQPYYTAVAPLRGRHALVAYAQAEHLRDILSTEARLWRRHAFVYDFDGNLLYASRATDWLEIPIRLALNEARAGSSLGALKLDPKRMWQWVASYHFDPTSQWIFVVAQATAWSYAPLLSFLACLIGLLWLARIPVKAAEKIQLQHYKNEIAQFSQRVEAFVHGKTPSMREPPFSFPELTPILSALRWLMPQWQKAAAYPGELALERKLLSILVESLPEAILFFNSQGILQLSNELGRVFFGMQQEAGHEYKIVNGRQVPRGFIEPFAEPVFLGAQKNLGKETEVSWGQEGKHLYRVWVEAVEEAEGGGKAAGYIVVIRDITFRKQWEVVQEQVLSGITHDLRGPLSAVMGYLDLMKRQIGADGNPKLLEYQKMAHDAGVRLTQMVSDILDVVRFEQGKIDIQIAPIPVAEIFSRLKSIFSVTADQKKISLKLVSDGPNDMRTYGDPKLLERIFDNLVGNALKFMPSGGTIIVIARRGKGRMLFEVQDTGRGIPREAQSRIFDKFQQVRPGDRSGGYGLGLAVVKFIVEAHQGEIRVESEVGVGSRFSFFIPDRPEVVAANRGVTPMSA